MKAVISLFAVAVAVAGTVYAADDAAAPAKAPSAQQGKMKDCNAAAGERKGDERKAFMKECLAAKPAAAAAPAPARTAQQEKMKTCNKEAGEKALKGAERRAFMSTCLKGDKS